MIPLGIAGCSQVIVIVKKEGNDVMSLTGPGARERERERERERTNIME